MSAKAAQVVFALGVAALVSAAAVSDRSQDKRPSSDVVISARLANGQGFTCSGVYLGNGIVLTAKHCVDKNVAKAWINLDQDGELGATAPIHFEWQSDKADIATYRVDGKIDAREAELACRAPVIGETIEIVGDPLSVGIIHSWGKVASVTHDVDVNKVGPNRIFAIDASIAPGNSGGPVYDANGDVIGLADLASFDGADNGYVQSPGRVDWAVSIDDACDKYGPKRPAWVAWAKGFMRSLWA